MQYESEYRCFPPAFVADKNGKPMHSWRVLILPFLNRRDLYDQYDFNEPWDGPGNRKLLTRRPAEFACPGDEDAWANGATTTSYVAVVGKSAFWRQDKPTSLFEPPVEGQLANSIMLIEAANSGIDWTEPKDLCLDDSAAEGRQPSRLRRSIGHFAAPTFFLHRAASSSEAAGACVSFADGHQEYLPAKVIASERFDEWLTVGGFDADKVYSSPPGRQIALLSQHRSAKINWTTLPSPARLDRIGRAPAPSRLAQPTARVDRRAGGRSTVAGVANRRRSPRICGQSHSRELILQR